MNDLGDIDKLKSALQILDSLDSIEKLTEDLNVNCEVLLEMIESLYEFKPELKEGEVFIETLSMKVLLTTRSILSIAKGEQFNTINKVSTTKLLDFPSIHVLTRSIIEAYLTLEYLFYNELNADEKVFRFNIWRLSGYKSRQNFKEIEDYTDEEIKLKLNSENQEIYNLLKLTKQSPYFIELNKNNIWKLNKFGLPRIHSWSSLIEASTLKQSLFSIPYSLYSNYAHSEFISLIQMNGANTLCKNSDDNKLFLKNALRLVLIVVSTSIIRLKDQFECTHTIYSKIDTELKLKIDTIYLVGTNDSEVGS